MTKIVRNVLNTREQFAFGNILKEEYTKSGSTYKGFADHINSTPTRAARVAELELQVERLTKYLSKKD